MGTFDGIDASKTQWFKDAAFLAGPQGRKSGVLTNITCGTSDGGGMTTEARIRSAEDNIACLQSSIESHNNSNRENRELIADENRKLKRYRKTRAAELRAEAEELDNK